MRSSRFLAPRRYRPGGGKLIYGIGQQAILHLRHIDIAEVIDEIAPRIIEAADRGNKSDDTTDFEMVRMNLNPGVEELPGRGFWRK
jgi:hypothetical protein